MKNVDRYRKLQNLKTKLLWQKENDDSEVKEVLQSKI